MGKRAFIAAFALVLLLVTTLPEAWLVSAQTGVSGQDVESLVGVNLVYVFAQGNFFVYVLNITRFSDFGSSSAFTLVDMYRIHVFIGGVLAASEGLAFFSNTNLPMTGQGGPSIMSIVVSVPAVHSQMAGLPGKVGNSSLESFCGSLDTSGIPTNSVVPATGDWVTVERMSSNLYNITTLVDRTGPNETMTQVSLVPYSHGYLYNTMLPQDQLPLVDLLNPTNDLGVKLQQQSQSPTPIPATTTTGFNATLSESASALNLGNTINFTVSVDGGRAPYTYTWNIEQSSDVVLVETTASPYYSSDIFGPGSHHVYVEVKDADNNTAKTLTVEFNVLPISSSSASPYASITPIITPSSSATQQPTAEPSQTPDRLKIGDFAPVIIPTGMIFTGIVAVGLLVYLRKRRG